MSATARRLVEAIQHSLVGPLIWRVLWPNAFFATVLVQSLGRDGPWEQQALNASFTILAIVLLAAFVAWLIGALARPAYQSLDLLSPSNGFEVWSRIPQGGLRPPPAVRAVLRLAEAWPRRLNPLAAVIGAACLVVVWMLVALPDQIARLHPALADPALRFTVIASLCAVYLLIDLTAWTKEQAKTLAPA